ncbi:MULTISPECIES: SAV_915 family protein [Kitasatospora]|uniref:SseB protein N-terminal domain-containing protein n=1 Tax=Kitasatospora setae (strain ATCC 33774 / DSM 43861 / JCM 3304 / KCC A-0304 / NBRC 14216 / KM-6054) TaxID=452652 RepID=E4NJ84_KITSK|nr:MULTISPECIES: SAV_915 family protein [Kitasatospora]BAJ33032.1 hypothetical protein KSE_72770 [Kitasatospora setae KM-6054]
MQQRPDDALLLVPVRPGPLGYTIRLFRTALGDRTAVAFTSEDLLVSVLGGTQLRTGLCAPALRALVAPLGITTLTIDPQLVAAAPRNRVLTGSVLDTSRPVPTPAPLPATAFPGN